MHLGSRRRRQAVVAGGLVAAGVVLSGFRPGSAGGLGAFLAAVTSTPLAGLWLGRSMDRSPTPIAPCAAPSDRIAAERGPTTIPDGRGARARDAVGTGRAGESRSEEARRHRAAALPWLVLGVAVLSWEMLALATPPRVLHLTLSSLVLHFRAIRAVAFVGWSAAGVALVAAGVEPPRVRPGRPVDGDRTRGTPPLLALFTLAVLVGTDPVVGITFWSLVALGGGVLELATRRRSLVSPLTALFRDLLGRWPGRAVLAAAWLVTGWHLFAHYPA